MRTLVLFTAAALAAPMPATAETRGPVHISSTASISDEIEAQTRETLADARRDLVEDQQRIDDMTRDVAQMEAGDFSRTLTIEDDKIIKCGDPTRYPGCVPYTDAEKAEMIAEMRADIASDRANLEELRQEIAELERELAAND